jgi:hypothetical protein
MNLKITMGQLFMFSTPTQHGLIREVVFNRTFVAYISKGSIASVDYVQQV